MRKHRSIMPHRSPGFDALEGRKLLNAGYFGAAPPEAIVIVGAPSHEFDSSPAEVALMADYQPESLVFGPIAWGQSDLLARGAMEPDSAPGPGLDVVWASPLLPSGGSSNAILVSADGAHAPMEVFVEVPAGDAINWVGAGPGFSPNAQIDSMAASGGVAPAISGQSPSPVTSSPGISSSPMSVAPTSSAQPFFVLPTVPGGGSNPPDDSENGFDGQEPPPFDLRGGDSTGSMTYENLFSQGQLGGPRPPGRLDPVEAGVSQSGLGNIGAPGNGVLSSGYQSGLVAPIEASQTSELSVLLLKAIDGPVSLAGTNAPVQPVKLLESDGAGVELSMAASDSPDHGISIASAEPSRIPGFSGPFSIASGLFRWNGGPSRGTNGAVPTELNPESSDADGADLIAEALPFARESLEDALEDFVSQLGGVDLGLFEVHGPAPIVMFAAGLLTSAVSAELVRRHLQRMGAQNRRILAVDPSGRQHTLGFPELPGSWSERRP
jgi:hypothetical protein